MDKSLQKEVIGVFKEIPDFTETEVQQIDAMNLPHKMEVDVTKAVEKLRFLFRIAIFEFVHEEILAYSKGFEQSDNTYCIFNYQYQNLKKMNLDNLPPNIEKKLLKLSITAVNLLLNKLEV